LSSTLIFGGSFGGGFFWSSCLCAIAVSEKPIVIAIKSKNCRKDFIILVFFLFPL